MKRAITYLLFTTFFLSCSKEKETNMLIGKWVEVAIYGNTGIRVEWIPAPAYANTLSLKSDGGFIYTAGRCGNGIGFGNYVYNPSSNELSLESKKYKVELLDKSNMILYNTDPANTLVQQIKLRKY
jgi:hypothetical protein